jgi:hypothetical protein
MAELKTAENKSEPWTFKFYTYKSLSGKVRVFKEKRCQAWWLTPVITALGKLKQENQEFKASLDYISSSRTAQATDKTLSQKIINK